MHRQGSIETFTLVLPQCPRVRKHAVTFRSSGKQFLITVAYIISSNHSPFVSGRRPVDRQRISRLLRLLAFANPDGSFREKGLTGISPIAPTCGGFPPRLLSMSSSILRIRLLSYCPDVFTPVSRQYPYARTVPLSCREYACHSVYSPAGPWWVSFNLAPREIVNHFREIKEMVARGDGIEPS